jgi:hypothetical protein
VFGRFVDDVRDEGLDNGHVVTATTDATGNVQFSGPAGEYRITVLGPWKTSGQPQRAQSGVHTSVAEVASYLAWRYSRKSARTGCGLSARQITESG